MCGRFALTLDPIDLQKAFPEFTFPSGIIPRYNIAPSQPILVLPNDRTKIVDYYIWGLIPPWAKEPSIGRNLINARSETIAEKPSFRSSFLHHRCLIFTNGFYEWQPQLDSKTKIPYFIRVKKDLPFAFAGIWDTWNSPDGSTIKSAAIITTDANVLIKKIHDRMPVILPKNSYAQWLYPETQPPAKLEQYLTPYPAEEMTAVKVSPRINNPKINCKEIFLPEK